MGKKNKKDYDSTTPEPFKPEKPEKLTPAENPDKTKKIEKNDPTRQNEWDITSQPGNKKNGDDGPDEDEGEINGSILNRTEV